MVIYISILYVTLGIAVLWKAFSMSVSSYATFQLSSLRDKLGKHIIFESCANRSDAEYAIRVLDSYRGLLAEFDLRSFMSALSSVRKTPTKIQPHEFSDRTVEKILKSATQTTVRTLPLTNLSLLALCVPRLIQDGFSGVSKFLTSTIDCIVNYELSLYDKPNQTQGYS